MGVSVVLNIFSFSLSSNWFCNRDRRKQYIYILYCHTKDYCIAFIAVCLRLFSWTIGHCQWMSTWKFTHKSICNGISALDTRMDYKMFIAKTIVTLNRRSRHILWILAFEWHSIYYYYLSSKLFEWNMIFQVRLVLRWYSNSDKLGGHFISWKRSGRWNGSTSNSGIGFVC